MKQKAFWAALFVGVFLVTLAGFSQAGGWMHKSSEAGKKVEQASGTHSPEFGSMEYWEALEAGTLPAGTGESSPSTQLNVPPILWGEQSSNAVFGGLEFRTIDVGP